MNSDEQLNHSRFRRAIFCVLWSLLLASTADVPEDDSAIIATAGQDTGVFRVKLNLGYHVCVMVHAVDLAVLWEAHIEEANSFIG